MTAPQIGTLVQYEGHEGVTMAAMVIMNAATYSAERDPSGQAQPADETSVSLKITRPVSGRSYVRHNVPLEGTPAHTALAQAAADCATVAELEDEEGAEDVSGSVDVAKPVVRFWRPIA